MLEFKEDILNAKIYNSGFKEDITAFNLNESVKIKPGISSKDDVIKFLGQPSGKALCPSTLEDVSKNVKRLSKYGFGFTQKNQKG